MSAWSSHEDKTTENETKFMGCEMSLQFQVFGRCSVRMGW